MLLTNNTEAPQEVRENTVISHVESVEVITDISKVTVPDVAMISTKDTKKKDSLLKKSTTCNSRKGRGRKRKKML